MIATATKSGPGTPQIVVAPPELHRQTISTPVHDPSLSGEIRAPASAIAPMRLDERRVIAHRAMLELDRPHAIVNLGIGMPEVRAGHATAGWTGMLVACRSMPSLRSQALCGQGVHACMHACLGGLGCVKCKESRLAMLPYHENGFYLRRQVLSGSISHFHCCRLRRAWRAWWPRTGAGRCRTPSPSTCPPRRGSLAASLQAVPGVRLSARQHVHFSRFSDTLATRASMVLAICLAHAFELQIRPASSSMTVKMGCHTYIRLCCGPCCNARFGASHNAECMVPCATMLDFYNGGGIDVTCLGAAEVLPSFFGDAAPASNSPPPPRT